MNMMINLIFVGYIFCINIVGFFTMRMDKRRAIKSKWRIPERTLLLIAIFGGGIGSYLGMRIHRHKTKHLSFRILLPAAALADLFLIYYFLVMLRL